MSNDEITAAATAAGAIDPAEMQAFIKPGEAGTPADQVAALKAAKPYLFKPDGRTMTKAEFSAAKAGLLKTEAKRQRQAADAADLARATQKFKT